MPRPKGSKDKKKRKRKVILTGKQEREIIKDYENGYTSSQIQKKYGITKSTLSTLRKERGIKPRLANSDVVQWKEVDDFNDINNTSGIYAIYFVWNYNKEDPDRNHKVNDLKVYIGSSVSMGVRLAAHSNQLSSNKHYNKDLQKRYNDPEFSVKYAIIEECSEQKLLAREGYYLDMWNMSGLFNMYKVIKEEDVRPWLEKAVTMDVYAKNYTISQTNFYNGTACKETNNVHKSGYGRMAVKIDETTKYFAKHRVAYWDEYGEYAELVRHRCNNSKCYNPKHLEKGSHRENMLDRRGDFPEEFERKWLQYEGDVVKLTEEFGWKANTTLKDGTGSCSVYEWEKKLGLREKHKYIVKRRQHNKFSSEEKDFLRLQLHDKTLDEINQEFIKQYNKTVGQDTIRRMGGCVKKPPKNKLLYDFIKSNLKRYWDKQLYQLVNEKFDRQYSEKRFYSFRMRHGLLRGNMVAEKQRLSLKDSDVLGPEIKEFIRQNFTKYDDAKIAKMCETYKIIDKDWLMISLPLGTEEKTPAKAIRNLRLKYYGFIKEGEEPIAVGCYYGTDRPIYLWDT